MCRNLRPGEKRPSVDETKFYPTPAHTRTAKGDEENAAERTTIDDVAKLLLVRLGHRRDLCTRQWNL